MKQFALYVACLAMLLSMSSCGDDGPEMDRQRDVTMTVKALTHVVNTSTHAATLTMDEENVVLVRQRVLTADFTLRATIDGRKQTFTVTGVPLSRVENQDYRYTFANASGGGVSNLHGMVDLSDQVLMVHYDVAGHHVNSAITDVFFAQTGVKFNYSDGSSTTAANSFWTLKVYHATDSANVIVNDLKIDRDTVVEYVTDKSGKRTEVRKRGSRIFTSLNGFRADVAPTAEGFTVTGVQLSSVATYGDGDHVAGGSSKQTEDYLLRDVNLNVNMEAGRLDGTLVIRHVLKRDADKFPTEWDDIRAQVSGETYRQSTIQ